jgi:hypothetical protein
MTTEEPLPKTVRFIYTKSDDHKVIYANGIHGGITLQGEVTFDLFLEQRLATKAEIHSIKEDGTLGPRTKTEPEIEPPEQGQAIVIREKMIGVVLCRDAAENIANWILSKVKQIDDNIKQSTAVEEQDAEE